MIKEYQKGRFCLSKIGKAMNIGKEGITNQNVAIE
tara:strand:- start:162 stop:266 length:105 start_codon:yes stop_codon:yes gene_type:complete